MLGWVYKVLGLLVGFQRLSFAVWFPPLSQEEDRLMIAVEETQFNLLELNNQLVGKMSLVNDAKAQLEKNNKSLQEKSRCARTHS